ncbi:hypothetical protein NITGR_150051 [Nitrospina gracilis 3/211]|uniref:Uncharacterized protein n=1 Tax=Nitrospina gracilis (strain 3/211) TaxID=1266370 RepID=M1YWN5_NITG3|nr:hypothetical protein NITGR_150051 [Nitrospina gracilis 3/211]
MFILLNLSGPLTLFLKIKHPPTRYWGVRPKGKACRSRELPKTLAAPLVNPAPVGFPGTFLFIGTAL